MTSFVRHLDERQAMLDGLRASAVAASVAAATDVLEVAAKSGRIILACGNGGSSSDADHIVAELVGRFSRTRPALRAASLTGNAASLTAIANDFGFEYAFSRQVEALGEPDGVLVAISTSGASPSVVNAARAARSVGMHVIALTGPGGGELAAVADICITVPGANAALIQDGHRIVYHYLCGQVDASLASPAAVST